MSRTLVARSHIQVALVAAAVLLASEAAMAQWRSNCRGYQYHPCPCQPGHVAPHGEAAPTPKDGEKKDGEKTPDGQVQPQPQPQQAPQDIDTSPSVAQAGGYTASNSTILGRVDQNNRLNLFDSMSALPMNRWWFNFLPMKRYNTNIDEDQSLSSGQDEGLLTQRLSQNLYRFGAELIIHPGVSVAFQGQYSTIQGNDAFDDVFTNPQIMLKAVLACDCCSILSGTFAIQPEVGTDDFYNPGINETTTRLYPGLLYFQDLGYGWFMQDGIQFGVPTESDQITTFDWAISLGTWLYQHPSLCCSSRCCCQPSILGVIAQVELFGKHVLGDRQIDDIFGTGLTYTEDRTVVDATAGIQVLMPRSVWVSVAASLPLTSDDVREVEGIVTVGQRW